ncbi:type II toxin-antitoxin system RelE/ParE family toxin [Polynucleobacter sp. AP-Latsch-80-C2]|jgi:putative addiction module killer protein|uniref:type II toxin-antitoxin system RelE/ParE family toxin n=1 Tax=Polynucleobacter sp. AP-Latsch-80-C2 TaxID=2576931 RepID=UPI001C0A960C|nr:type II toxin-antitoxin system RelE/ParE family toxin [Polynucleobacter sp. AP-Latsch-80-C2]MBU3623232.1 type II toxin-antitoxin system RelE/ParE family toxin [Polynucleobacter sp. AP-Latsch-80-C2]
MYEIRKTEEFESWLKGIRDSITQKRLLARLRKLSLGSLGDVSPIANGIWEMREHFGVGWRMYYIQYEKIFLLMLGGGSKATQASDIERVKRLLKNLEK